MTGPEYAGDSLGYMFDYIDLAAANGIDLFRIWLNWGNVDDPSGGTWDAFILHPYLRTGPGQAFDGKPKVDVTAFDPKYFSQLVSIVDHAAAKGIVVQAMLLDCWHVGFGLASGFQDRDYFSAQNNVNGVSWSTEAEWLDPNGEVFPHNRAFVEKVVETIGDRKNIIWETCNEKKQGDHSTFAASAADPFHQAVAKAVHDKEQALGFPRHLVIPVDLPEHRTVAGHETPTNGAAGQESIAAMRARLIDPQLGWGVPLISDNDCCNGEPDAAFIRRKAWAALTAGAHVDVFNNELFQKSVLSNANTANGMKWVGLTRKMVESLGVNLVGMAPHDELGTNGAWVYARPGQEYVLYLSTGGATTLSGLPAGASGTWFDPRTGATSGAGAGPTFTATDSEDWVLYVAVN
jgi:Cellulase (glycosyl hydrolase family 5)